MEEAPALITRVLRKADIAVTECRSDKPENGISGSIPVEDAYLMGLQLRDYPEHDYWEGSRQHPRRDVKAGEILLYDLKRDPRFFINKPFHSIHFYLPRKALDAIADEAQAPRISELRYEPGVGMVDEVVRNLGTSLLAAFDRPEQVSRLFMDHVTFAIATHVTQTYGGLWSTRNGSRAGWPHGRSAGPARCSRPIWTARWRSAKWRRNAACRSAISRGPFGRAPAWLRINGCFIAGSRAPSF
jgi:hypothetical protein